MLSRKQLILPSALTTIDSEAFTGIKAESIVIPDSVSYIADNAFDCSEIKVIYGASDYVCKYASEHGFEFKRLDE